ncbi:hydroxyacid dehydrogenase [Streptomyces sp. NPDC046215]
MVGAKAFRPTRPGHGPHVDGERSAVVVVAMGADAAAAVLPAELRTRLGECAEPFPGVFTGPLTTPEARVALGGAGILLTGWGCPALTEDVLGAAPRLWAVVHAAGSVKSLVTEAVWGRGIVVSSAADVNAGPVADFTLAAIVFAAKGALPTAAAYASGWPAFRDRQGADSRTIGVIGASRVGRRVMAGLRASAAGFRILLHDPYVSAAEAAALGAESVSAADLCRSADIVTVHAPETPETRHLLGAGQLALIRDGGTVINTARGSLVDTEALTRECAAGRLGAFLDVTDPEPLPAGHRLLSLPNVLVTPHIAGAQGSEARRLGAFAVEEVARLVRGEPLLGQVVRDDLGRLA